MGVSGRPGIIDEHRDALRVGRERDVHDLEDARHGDADPDDEEERARYPLGVLPRVHPPRLRVNL
jgi:hypothetical protein